jgi:hypothetical protein
VLNLLRQRFKTENNVKCLLKARIAEPEKMFFARQWLFKTRFHGNQITCPLQQCTRNNRGAVRGSVFFWDRAEAV